MTRYELLERIGVGGMAEIFRGKAVAGRGFEKPVAIKRILPHLSEDKRFVELLITEAKTLSELRHRNIVQIYDVGLGDDGQYFLVMEFVDGVDLADLYDEVTHDGGRLPIEVSLYVGAEICEALEHAHLVRDSGGALVNLVHRDVSPSNILLSQSGEVKLTDFGIAKRVEELTGHGGVRGKFAYISPEQADNRHVDGRSDVHSLGMVLFELVSGKRLFSAMPDFDALAAVREHRMPRLRDVDPAIESTLESVIMKALEADPARRYQSAREFASALRDYRYGMVSSTGDPAQAVARAVRGVITPPRMPSAEMAVPEPVGEGTVVRIVSSAGLGVPYDDYPDTNGESRESDDPYASARAHFDSHEDEPTMASRTPPPSRHDPPGRQRDEREEESTHISRPTPSPRGKMGRRGSVDPDADTELSLAGSAGVEGDRLTMRGKNVSRAPAIDDGEDEDEDEDEDDFDGEIETRVLDRKDPKIMAGILRSAYGDRRAQLPGPSVSHRDEQQPTVPRAEPVRPAASPPIRRSNPPPALSPQYPSIGPSELRGLGVIREDNLLGMPRHIAYWVAGGVAAVLIIIVIAVAGGSGSDTKGAGDGSERDVSAEVDGGNDLVIVDDE